MEKLEVLGLELVVLGGDGGVQLGFCWLEGPGGFWFEVLQADIEAEREQD